MFKRIEKFFTKIKFSREDSKKFSNFSGAFRDKITYNDGRVVVTDWSHNLIVDDIVKLVSALFKGESGYSGLTYWAVGSGLASWDTNGFPAPLSSDTKLLTELGRKAIASSDISYLTDTGEVSATPTGKIKIVVTFLENECNGSWREFGLFGGNASITADSGIMIDRKTHALLTKEDTMQVERELRLSFN